MPEKPRSHGKRTSRARLLRRVFFGITAIGIIGLLSYAIKERDQYLPLPGGNPSDTRQENSSVVAIYCAKSCVTLDEDGRAVYHAPRPNGNLILYIDSESANPPQIGERIVSDKTLKELTYIREEVLNLLGVQMIKASQSRLVAEDFDILTNQGWRVRLSTSNNAFATVRILAETLEQVKQKNQSIEYIDLRIENRVYLKTL